MSNNREWILGILKHQQPASVPYYFDFTPPARARVEQHYGSPIEDALDLPIRMMGCKSIKPLYADPDQFGSTAKDEFGVIWSTSKSDRGSPVSSPLVEPDLSGYQFSDPDAEYRFEDLEDWCIQNRDNFTIVWVGDLWERATFMRGMENILMDLVINPGFVSELLERIANRILRTMEILFNRFTFDGIALSDDYGAQTSLLMSPADWRKFIKPHLANIYGLARRNNRAILHHSDGCITSIIPDLIEIGCDILHPCQPESMDIFQLKHEFGQDVTFWGGMQTQELLPRGTPDAIRKWVAKLKREMGRNGGYVVSNGITIQGDVPLENLVAMIDQARQ